ncbi:DNA cytosine methyltransferase [Fulvivirgaceae bacterium BMA10]|uniref:DNA (cytosine-5-)-methyltransferase n=1 Tax=Splendidivirga corallicola TaxID=3051826 RepID=A0ABT8KVW3_9BACT|nr:DNA cytosine methyltransferase [Fulvivirgaceae bacterium BMA10]
MEINHIMTNITKNLKALDFFCSAGGVTCGFKQAGIDVLGGIDIDPSCKETYEKNNATKYLTADVSNLRKEEVGKFFGIRKYQGDLIFVGCSPCQYYSNINTDKRKSKSTRLLLEDFQDFVEYYRPGYVFIENVPGFDKKPESPINKFKLFLTENGYSFKDGVVNAKNYGVPQNRRRYILIASRLTSICELPKPDKTNVKTVFEAIGNQSVFKPIEAGHKDKTDFIHSSASLSKLNMNRIINTTHNGGDRRSWPDCLKSEGFKKHGGHYDVYGRMKWNSPSPTITTRFVSYSNGRYGHPEQNRAISLREGAALQSFPLNYIFISNSQGTIARMIGNAVPPVLAKAIGLTILKYANGNK